MHNEYSDAFSAILRPWRVKGLGSTILPACPCHTSQATCSDACGPGLFVSVLALSLSAPQDCGKLCWHCCSRAGLQVPSVLHSHEPTEALPEALCSHEPTEALPSVLPLPGPGLPEGFLPCHLWIGLVTTSGCAPLPLVGAVGQVPCAVPAVTLAEPLVLPVSPSPGWCGTRRGKKWERPRESAMLQGPLKVGEQR